MVHIVCLVTGAVWVEVTVAQHMNLGSWCGVGDFKFHISYIYLTISPCICRGYICIFLSVGHDRDFRAPGGQI